MIFYRVLLLLSLIFSVHSAHCAEEKRLLIIGNSYSFYNDLPKLLQAMANADDTPLTVDSYTAGAMSLRGFLNSPQHAAGKNKLIKGNYDYLLLQDQSQTPAYKPDETLDSVHRWCKLAGEHGAKPILFLTWAHATKNGNKVQLLTAMQDDTSLTYCRAAVADKAKVAPVGEAWRRWYIKHPDTPLHAADMSHPTAEGTYLAACVIYSTITGKKATAIPVRLKSSPVRISAGRAKELQKTAAETLKNFTPAGGDIITRCEALIKDARREADLVKDDKRQPFDPREGALLRRREMFEFVAYCAGQIIKSIKTKKRVPEDRRPLNVRTWW